MSVYARRGLLVRMVYLTIALVWWVATGFGWMRRRLAVVLCYHGILDTEAERFAWQMRRIADRAVPATGLRRPPGRRRGPAVCVTFDDGFTSVLRNSLPVMRELRVPATLFVVAGNMGLPPRWTIPADHPEAGLPLTSREELGGAVRDGLCCVGSHTLTHPPDLPSVSGGNLRRELAESKAALEQVAGRPIHDFAFPNGRHTPELVRAVAEAGYRRIFTLDEKPFDPSRREPCIGRFSMTPDVWRIEFVLTCAGAYSWLHIWRKLLRQIRSLRAQPEREPSPA